MSIDISPRRSAEAGLHNAVRVEDQRRRRLQHMEVLGDVGAMGQIDVEVGDAVEASGDVGQGAVHGGAAGAHLGAELQQGRSSRRSGGAPSREASMTSWGIERRGRPWRHLTSAPTPIVNTSRAVRAKSALIRVTASQANPLRVNTSVPSGS